MPIEWEPRGRDFPRRNRIVSGMALGTVIVEAARGSGSLITARFAAEQNREVFAVPGSPLDPRAEGTNDLLRDGANLCARVGRRAERARPVARARSFFDSARGGRERSLRDEQGVAGRRFCAAPHFLRLRERLAPDPLDLAMPSDARLAPRAHSRSASSPSPISLDELVRAAEAPISEVRIVLLELELAGRLEYSGGARVSLAVASGERE